MKILILYDSRHGFTEHCLGLLTGAPTKLWFLVAQSTKKSGRLEGLISHPRLAAYFGGAINGKELALWLHP